tara:strand:+ start:111 stop:446 length:336 start_codon:yes stop_codon:yes gene_type:complete
MKRKKGETGLVYSTNPHYEIEDDSSEEGLAPHLQELKVYLDRKNRGGKIATIIRGFIGPDNELVKLSKKLKTACGVGGSVKQEEIIIQGEKRDKVMELLKKEGFKVKRVGG